MVDREESDGSSSSGSSSAASSNGAWASSTSSSSLITALEVFEKTSYAINTVKRFRWFDTVVLGMSLLSLLCVPLDALIRSSAPSTTALHYDVATSDDLDSSRTASVYEIPRYLFDPSAATWGTQVAFVWVSIVTSVTILLGFAWVLWTCWRGLLPSTKLMLFLNHSIFFGSRVLAFPMMFACVRAIVEGSVLGIVTGVIGLIPLVPMLIYTSIFHVDFIPSITHTAQINSRFELLLTLCRILVSSLYPLERVSDVSRAAVLTGLFLVLALVILYQMPFWKNRWNGVFLAIFTACLWLSCCALAGAAILETSADGTSSNLPFIIGLSGSLPFGVCSWFGFFLYSKWLKSRMMLPIDQITITSELQVERLIRTKFGGGKLASEEESEQAVDLIFRAKEQFQESFILNFMHAMVLMELQHDPRGMMIHMKNARRFTVMPDILFVTTTLLLHGQETVQRDVSSRRNIDLMLETAARHTRHAKSFSTKFWQQVLRGRATGMYNDRQMFDLMVSLHYHDTKARDLLLYLIGRYPTDFKVLRQYARFLDELHNDREAAKQMFVLADQCEEDAARNQRRKEKKRNAATNGAGASRHVRMAPDTIDSGMNEQQEDVEMGTAPGAGNYDNESVDESEDAKSESSIGSSASSAGTNANVHAKAIRARISNVKSEATRRYHLAVILTLIVLSIFLILLFSLGVTSISSFSAGFTVVNGTLACKQSVYQSLFNARLKELLMMETLHLTNRSLPGSKGKDLDFELARSSDEFESLFNYLFQHSQMSDEIDSFWGTTRYTRFYIPGANKSNVYSGTWKDTQLPLWDIGYTFLNSVRDVTRYQSLAAIGAPNLRTTTPFRFIYENGPSGLVDALTEVARMHALLLTNTTDSLLIRMYIIFPIIVCLAVLFFGLRVAVIRSIGKERDMSVKLFNTIPKSTLVNITERLHSSKDQETIDEVITRSSTISTIAKLEIVSVLTTLVLLGLAAGIFGIFVSFAQDNGSAGKLLLVTGKQRNHLGALKFWSQELVVKSYTFQSFNQSQQGLRDVIAEFNKNSLIVKYGDTSQGVKSLIATDHSFYDLWYDRECPVELNLTHCRGLGQYMTVFMDLVVKLSHTDVSVASLFNPDYAKSIQIHEGLARNWYLQMMLIVYSAVIKASDAISTNVTVVFVMFVPVLLIGYIIAAIFIRRLSTEVEGLVQMLLCVPLNVLETTSNIKKFLEVGRLVMTTEKKDENLEEQKIQHILDGSSDAVVVCDAVGNIEMMNPALLKLTGFERDELVGNHITLLLQKVFPANSEFVDALFLIPEAAPNSPIQVSPSTAAESSSTGVMKGAREVKLMLKVGATLDVMVTVSRSVANGKASFGLFMRDITELRQREEALDNEKQRAEAILMNILPRAIIAEMAIHEKGPTKAGGAKQVIAHGYNNVSVMFVNICGFSELTKEMNGEGVVMLLNTLVCQWDKSALQFGNAIEKIKTIGDIYMCCSGAPVECEDHAEAVVEFAIAILAGLKEFNETAKVPIKVKIGINSGPVVGGVLGLHKFVFDIYGDCVNVASRMQSNGVENRIQISQSTYEKIQDKGYKFLSRGKVLIKGKGEMECYLIDPVCYSDDIGQGKLVGNLERKYSSKLSMGPPHGGGLVPIGGSSLSREDLHAVSAAPEEEEDTSQQPPQNNKDDDEEPLSDNAV